MPRGEDLLYAKADELATIRRIPYWIASTVMFALAVVALISRVFLKFRHKLGFGIDDYILFFAAACLITGSGLHFVEIDNVYLGPVMQKDPTLVELLGPGRVSAIFNTTMKHQHAFFTLVWTVIWLVKLAFLAFFKSMLNHMRKMQIYWWFIVAVTIPSWAYIAILTFFICGKFGPDSVQCLEHPKTRLYAVLMATGGTLDMLTDFMIVSIPVIVLHRVTLPLRQKFTIGAFLCLSIIMSVMALIRSVKVHGPKGVPIDMTWSFFWEYMEACVGVIMASLTAFRTTFNLSRERDDYRARMQQPSSGFWDRRRAKNSETANSNRFELDVPKGKMRGMRTFMPSYRDKRGSGESVVTLSKNDQSEQSAVGVNNGSILEEAEWTSHERYA